MFSGLVPQLCTWLTAPALTGLPSNRERPPAGNPGLLRGPGPQSSGEGTHRALYKLAEGVWPTLGRLQFQTEMFHRRGMGSHQGL